MSVQNQTVKNVYAGNGSTTVFPFTFALNEDDGEYVGVYVTNEEGTSELTHNYTINTTAKTVTYPTTGDPLPADRKITILRELPNEQNLNLENLGPFFADDVEDEMDREVMMIQQLSEQVARAVKVDVADDLPSADVIYDINHIKEYKAEAADSAANAAASETAAGNSATAAAGSEAAAKLSEQNASTSETNAAASAAAALASKNAAALSEGNAASSATDALNSKNAAAISANASATSAAASAADAVTAGNAASVVNTALPQILTAAASAGTSATAAQASAAAAALSAGTATTQAELASGYADSAAEDAADAAGSASDAADSAAAAAESATEAEEANTEAKYYAKITMDKVAESAVGYPHQEGTLTYDGTEQSPTWDVFYEPQKMTVTGTTSATDAGTYTITMTPKPTYYWWDTGTTAARTQTWTIGRQAISTVPSQSGTLTYDGTEQSPTWADYDSTKMTIGGTTAATNAGTYTATFTPTANYKWSDGTTTAKSVTWTIDAQSVTVPTVTNTSKTYNGAAQSPTISAYDSNIIQVSGDTETNAGSYAVVFHLVSATNYVWTDSTTADKSVSWTIAAKSVTIPTVTNTTKTYNGSAQSPTISAYDPAEVAVSGTATATNAGSYTITFSLASITNYKWSDDSTAAKTASWSIAKASLAVPTLSNTSKTYSGSSQAPTISAYDATLISATGDLSAINAGSYTITFSLIDTTNTAWTDTTTADKTASWTIAAKSVAVPVLSNTSKTYNGTTQSPTISSFSVTEITQSGTASAINAGTYTITWSLTSTTNYIWSDSTTAPKSANWTISKAAGSLSLSKNSVSLNTSQLTDTITVTRTGDGTISAVSSDTSIATVSVSGTTVTVTAVASGSATVTVSVAAGTNWLAPSDATASVAVSLVDTVLNNNSWATISQVAQAGTGDTYWDVGDVKMIELNGKIGDYFTADHLSLGVFILDFNHPMNGTAENNIIFGGFKTAVTGGVDVALCDSGYGSMKTSGLYFNMNHVTESDPVNYGGWKGSDLRYDILGATSQQPSQYNTQKTSANVGYDATAATLTSPKADTFLAALPSDLRGKIRLWTRYIDAVGGGTNSNANIKATVDAVTLLAESEIFASRKYANSYEQNYNTRMAYYTAGNRTIKYKHSESSTAVVWWECSPNYSSASYFCRVDSNGAADYHAANRAYGLAPAFKI